MHQDMEKEEHVEEYTGGSSCSKIWRTCRGVHRRFIMHQDMEKEEHVEEYTGGSSCIKIWRRKNM